MHEDEVWLSQNASYQVHVIARGGLSAHARAILRSHGLHIHAPEVGDIRYSATGPIVATTDASPLTTEDVRRMLGDEFDVHISE
jgi:hypothetical protein